MRKISLKKTRTYPLAFFDKNGGPAYVPSVDKTFEFQFLVQSHESLSAYSKKHQDGENRPFSHAPSPSEIFSLLQERKDESTSSKKFIPAKAFHKNNGEYFNSIFEWTVSKLALYGVPVKEHGEIYSTFLVGLVASFCGYRVDGFTDGKKISIHKDIKGQMRYWDYAVFTLLHETAHVFLHYSKDKKIIKRQGAHPEFEADMVAFFLLLLFAAKTSDAGERESLLSSASHFFTRYAAAENHGILCENRTIKNYAIFAIRLFDEVFD